jgi:exodeoxyribonuclease V beta subunit
MSPTVVPFDVLGPLPTGTTLLEASAGTGKTWTIAALLTRFVAEGAADLREVLLITFGRAATRELRERVRERLVEARDVLSLGPGPHPDPLLGYLATGNPDVVAARHARLAAACVDFDAATIATTHGFCQLVIRSLGTAADADPTTDLLEDLGDLVEEVALDLYLRRWAPGGDPLFSAAEALAIAGEATLDSHARLLPVNDPDETASVRARFATAVRDEVARRLHAQRAMSFDDLLAHLARVLTHPQDGETVARRLRGRYRFVLVDEFQDTDPVQWEILERAFHGHATLVLIGDPKQAIYAFRGGDVHSYLGAAAVADTRATLRFNWRSDAALLRGLDAVFDGAALGEDEIVVGPVAAGRPEPRLRHAGSGRSRAPVQVRIVPTAGLPTRSNGDPLVPGVRSRVIADLVAAVVDVLTDGSEVAAAPDGPWRAVLPGDIAVLVRSNSQAEQVRDALVSAGVPSVLRATSNVFATAAATDWLVLLEAVEQPHRVGRVRRLAVSAFIGRDAAGLDAGGEAAHDALAHALREWGTVLTERGVAALFTAVDAAHGAVARLLGQVGGERQATDLRHVGEILHTAAVREGLGPAALLTWLRRRIEEAATPQSAERSRRLDSDAAAVQVVTVHASKGLEFPLVYVPFGWDRNVNEPKVALFHDKEGRRCRDVGGPTGADWVQAVRCHQREEAGEDLRLFYVAATRARSALTVWWARSTITGESAVHRLLCRATGPGNPPARVTVPDEAGARATIAARAAASGGALEVITATLGPARRWTPAVAPTGVPVAARFDRAVDTDWRRTSYSGLTALAHEAGPHVFALAEPETVGTVDEPAAEEETATPGAPAAHVPAPAFALLPAGAAFGTVVHTVLERVDLAAADPTAALVAAATAALARTPIPELTGAELGETLLDTLHTPLGAIAGGRPLRAFAADRLSELDFELPLAGGDKPGRLIRLAELAPVLEAHLAPEDPVRTWLPRLSGPDLAGQPLRGYLSGSIDVVLRVPEGPGYLVVDYKTNRLHAADETPTRWHYRTEALQAAMFAADYPLQALLYQVALHRYLTWRQPGYDPERHLRGALYLFLRGMPGADVPSGDEVPGVYAWRPRPAAIVAVSAFLAGELR